MSSTSNKAKAVPIIESDFISLWFQGYLRNIGQNFGTFESLPSLIKKMPDFT